MTAPHPVTPMPAAGTPSARATPPRTRVTRVRIGVRVARGAPLGACLVAP